MISVSNDHNYGNLLPVLENILKIYRITLLKSLIKQNPSIGKVSEIKLLKIQTSKKATVSYKLW